LSDNIGKTIQGNLAFELAADKPTVAIRRRPFYGEYPTRGPRLAVGLNNAPMRTDERALQLKLNEAQRLLQSSLTPFAADSSNEVEPEKQPGWIVPAQEYIHRVTLAYLHWFLQPNVKHPPTEIRRFEAHRDLLIGNAWLHYFQPLAQKWNNRRSILSDYLGCPSGFDGIDEETFHYLMNTDALCRSIAKAIDRFYRKRQDLLQTAGSKVHVRPHARKDAAVREGIIKLKRARCSQLEICERLAQDGVPLPSGVSWRGLGWIDAYKDRTTKGAVKAYLSRIGRYRPLHL
jgi:hypothetical protein